MKGGCGSAPLERRPPGGGRKKQRVGHHTVLPVAGATGPIRYTLGKDGAGRQERGELLVMNARHFDEFLAKDKDLEAHVSEMARVRLARG